MSEAYTSTIVAPVQIGFGVISGAVVGGICIALSSGLWPFAIAAFVIIVATGIYLGSVSLTVTADRVTIGQGRGEREPRVVYAAEIQDVSAAEFSWAQIFGIGVPTKLRTTRLTVRPGPTLCLILRDGEVIRISTADPAAAQRVLAGAGKEIS